MWRESGVTNGMESVTGEGTSPVVWKDSATGSQGQVTGLYLVPPRSREDGWRVLGRAVEGRLVRGAPWHLSL